MPNGKMRCRLTKSTGNSRNTSGAICACSRPFFDSPFALPLEMTTGALDGSSNACSPVLP
jgi:hypothetical protein